MVVTFPTENMSEDWTESIPADYIIYSFDVWGIESGDIYNTVAFGDVTYVMERTAHYISRLVNYAVRKSMDSEISVPNAAVKLFAPRFINEKGEVKTGEIYEIHEVQDRGVAERLDEAADIVGKYALGIERVASAISNDEDTKWQGFAQALSEALGFDYQDVLGAFIVKYDQRFQHGKNKEEEFKRVSALVDRMNIRPLKTTGSIEERIQKVREQYEIDKELAVFASDTNEVSYSLQGRKEESIITVSEEMLIQLDEKRNENINGMRNLGIKKETFSYHRRSKAA